MALRAAEVDEDALGGSPRINALDRVFNGAATERTYSGGRSTREGRPAYFFRRYSHHSGVSAAGVNMAWMPGR